MTFQRQEIGDPLNYKKHRITVEYCGPDVICKVNGTEESSSFYLHAEAARKAGMRFVDLKLREKSKEEAI